MQPELFLFDMDHTLVDNDCDVSWKYFLCEIGMIPKTDLQKAESFFEDYAEGRLEIEQFMEFQLAEFRGRTEEEIKSLTEQHFRQHVKPHLYSQGEQTVHEVLQSGFPVALLTATNCEIARPLAEYLGIREVLAVRPQIKDRRFTGSFIPPYSGGANKVLLAEEFCRRHDKTLLEAAYYGDSHNDLPILEAVGFPRIVNPNSRLRKLVENKDWPILRWK